MKEYQILADRPKDTGTIAFLPQHRHNRFFYKTKWRALNNVRYGYYNGAQEAIDRDIEKGGPW